MTGGGGARADNRINMDNIILLAGNVWLVLTNSAVSVFK
jgi:hypothetical protein